MASQLTILPVIIQPKKDELFSSWLFRLACKNFSKAHTFCRFHLPGYSIWNRDIDRLASDQMINRLSLLTEIPIQTIYQLTLRSYENIIFVEVNKTTKQKWVLPLGIYHRTWKNFGLQYCPRCLSRDSEPYFRKFWRLGISVVCTECQLLLHDCCPNCRSPISFFRTDVGFKIAIAPKAITICPKCDFDLKESPRYSPMLGTIGFQIKINKIIETNRWRKDYSSLEYLNVLYQILKILKSESSVFKSFNDLILDSESMRISKLAKSKDFETLTTVEREHLIRIGCWLLEDWPERFISISKEAKLNTSAALRDSKSLPLWFVSEVNRLHRPTAIELNPKK